MGEIFQIFVQIIKFKISVRMTRLKNDSFLWRHVGDFCFAKTFFPHNRKSFLPFLVVV